MSLTPIAASFPGDFEKHSAVILGCNELLAVYPQVLLDVVDALIDRVPLIGIVDSEEQRRQLVTLLCDWGLPAHLMHYVCLPVRGLWIRDYGPSFVRKADGRVLILDAQYRTGVKLADDLAPTELAALMKLSVVQMPLSVEGGNLLSNGKGLCLTTDALFDRNAKIGMREPEARDMLTQYYGFNEIVALRPLQNEPTGHVDLFAAFTGADTVVVGAYDKATDPANAELLDDNARRLEQVRTASGPLRVVRIPMPTNAGGFWRTYTSVLFASNIMLMPVYLDCDPQIQRQAVQIYSELMSDREIEGIDCTALVLNRGGVRGLSVGVPWMTERFASPKNAAASTLPAQEPAGSEMVWVQHS